MFADAAARRGFLLYVATMAVFATQDAFSRILAADHSPFIIVMYRYWALALFVLPLCARRPGGLRRALTTRRPALQFGRGVLLALQICIITYSFAAIGLAETHALMAFYPLFVAALSAVFLGEKIGPLTWAAISVGLLGVFILLNPGAGVFDWAAVAPLATAFMFAAYGVLTRVASRDDGAMTSFLYMVLGGALVMTLIGPFYYSPFSAADWAWMAALCVSGGLSHLLLIMAYEHTDPGKLQPFAYLQLALASAIGVLVFGEILDARLILGAGVIVSAGLLVLVPAALRRRRKKLTD